MTSPTHQPATARGFAALLALLIALGTSVFGFSTAAQAQPSASEIEITDIAFQNESFADGTRTRLDVAWSTPANATNPVAVTIDLPDELKGFPDTFPMMGPDGEEAGTCVVTETSFTCTADAAFIDANPDGVEGTFTVDVQTTLDNRETVDKTFDIGGFTNSVTVTPNPAWCTENCDFNGTGAGKWGWYDSVNDQIIWTVRIPAPEQGIPAGQQISITDILDADAYTLANGDGFPKVREGRSLGFDRWGREGIAFADRTDGVTWSDDNLTATFESRAGLGQDAELPQEPYAQRGTDGSFYEAQWRVDVNIPGDVDANGDRVFTNDASYTIDGSESNDVSGSAVRYQNSGTVTGRNYARFAVTKTLAGDTSLSPTFTVNYTATPANGEPTNGSFQLAAGETWTSPEFFRGTTITLDEVLPTDPSNVDWATPEFTPSDNLEFIPGNGTLGRITQVALDNEATLQRDSVDISKTVQNPDAVPGLPESYTVDYSYPTDAARGIAAGSGSIEVPASGTSVNIADLPVGAVVTFTEQAPQPIAGATWAAPEISPSSLTVGEDSSAAISVTNSISQDVGGFSIAKALSGDGQPLVPEDTEYTVSYQYEGINGFAGGSGQVTVKAGETSEPVTGIPAGATVTLTELEIDAPEGATWGEPEFSQSSFTIVKDTVVGISLDNPVSWNDGDFSIVKQLAGDGAELVDDSTQFTVEYSYELPEELNADPATGTGQLTVRADGEIVKAPALPFGTKVTLDEATPAPVPGGTWTGAEFSESSLTIGDETTVAVTLTNTIERDLGSFAISKVISGTGSHLVSDDTTFTVEYSYPEGPGFEAGEGTVTVGADGSPVVVENIPAGATVTLSEVAPEGVTGGTWASATFVDGNIVVVEKDGRSEVTLDNEIVLNTGAFSVAKSLAGSGADLVDPDTTFTVRYQYAAGPSFEAGSGELTVRADGTAVSSGPLPFGAVVELDEMAPADIKGGSWSAASFSQDTITIGDNVTTTVDLVNTFEKDAPPKGGSTPPKTGGDLPRTGTSIAMALAIGLALIGFGTAILVRRRRS